MISTNAFLDAPSQGTLPFSYLEVSMLVLNSVSIPKIFAAQFSRGLSEPFCLLSNDIADPKNPCNVSLNSAIDFSTTFGITCLTIILVRSCNGDAANDISTFSPLPNISPSMPKSPVLSLIFFLI